MDSMTSSPTIMIVDDSKTIRRTAETLLQREGFSVVTAEDGFEALAKIAALKPVKDFFKVVKSVLRMSKCTF